MKKMRMYNVIFEGGVEKVFTRIEEDNKSAKGLWIWAHMHCKNEVFIDFEEGAAKASSIVFISDPEEIDDVTGEVKVSETEADQQREELIEFCVKAEAELYGDINLVERAKFEAMSDEELVQEANWLDNMLGK